MLDKYVTKLSLYRKSQRILGGISIRALVIYNYPCVHGVTFTSGQQRGPSDHPM